MAIKREFIVQTALALLDETGLNGLTIRRLAEELGIKNPALYWHFKSKQDLLDSMAEAMLRASFADLKEPGETEDWADWLAGVGIRLRNMLLSCRDGTRIMAEANLKGSMLPLLSQRVVQVLRTAGIEMHIAQIAAITIFDFTLGAAFEEQSDMHHAADRTPPEVSEPLPDEVRPLSSQLGAGAQLDRRTAYEAGLQLIISGIRAQSTGRV